MRLAFRSRNVRMVMGSLLTVTTLPVVCQAAEKVVLESGALRLEGQLCRPRGSGPFAAVVYQHGGLGDRIGGAPNETCEALARAGFLGFSLVRRSTPSLEAHLEDADVAVEYVKSRSDVDPRRLGVIGFSRGGLLAWQQAVKRSDLSAVVIMAVAVNDLLRLSDAGKISAPLLLQVAKNDTGSRLTKGRNTLEFTRAVARALEIAGREGSLIVYRAYGQYGHTLFFSVNSRYWPDVVGFLTEKLSPGRSDE